jgi:hypothetical protein
MPTSNFAQITVGGPCKITDALGNVIYTEGNVTLTPKPKYRDVGSSLTTKDDQTLVGLVWEIDFIPKSIWTVGYRASLIPTTYVNFLYGGTRIIGAVQSAMTILATDGEGWAITRGALTKMPNIYHGLGKSLYSACQFTAFLGNGNALTDANAFMVPTTGNAWSQADFPTGNQESECTASWAPAGVAGFNNMFAQEGFELQHELETADVKQGNITVDKRIVGYRGMVVFKPEGPTTLQLNGQFPGAIGSRLSAGAADFVISMGGGSSTTLKLAMPYRGKYNFDAKLMRHDEFAFVTALTQPGARLAFT